MIEHKAENPICVPETSLRLVRAGRIVTGEKYIEELIRKFKLYYSPAHQIWESGNFESQAIKLLGLSKDNLYIGLSKANYKYNNSHYPNVGLWVNAKGNYGILWFVSKEAKKLYIVQRIEYSKFLEATERKIREGSFTWTSEYREASGTSRSSSSDRWRVDYRVVGGVVNIVYNSGRDGYSSIDVPYDISSSGKSTDSWKEDSVGTPLEEDFVDFRCWYGNIQKGSGNGAFHYSGNGIKWINLIKELYPEIRIPE